MTTPAPDTVRLVMTGRILAVTADTTLDTALRLMTEARVRHLPVMDGSHCVGILHESDILWTLWTHGPIAQAAGGCSRTPAAAVGPDDPVATAAARIDGSGAEAVLVTVNGAIVGIVTAADIVHYLGAHDGPRSSAGDEMPCQQGPGDAARSDEPQQRWYQQSRTADSAANRQE